ncbi:SEC14-like protein 2 [Orchesella cincta]|uniref:SEC14-like protein 2 n=1 Tax=Orchesella cincta TaxID=48709 RepID=A0A1D2M7Z0_ORCCI|nr:SEC14-like protein 2 [Orchesella cincta]
MKQSNFSVSFLALAAFLVGCNVKAISVEKYLTLTLSQKSALDKFKDQVMPMLKDNYMKQDTYLIQWLRARNFDINSAETMIRENLKWREENGIDNITKEDWSDMTIDTYDKTGRPIGVIDIYDWNTRGAVLGGKGARLHRYDISIVENITRQVYKLQDKGINVTQVVVLGNAAGFNVVQHACPVCLPIWIQFVQVIESYYPGALDELIIIDATPAIQILMEALKPFFSQNTRDAIKVFGPNRAKWMEYLDNKISREERRKHYGGTKPPLEF